MHGVFQGVYGRGSKKPRGEPVEMIIGVGFYRREQWPLFLATAVDKDNLEDTYDEWLEGLKRSLIILRAEGADPVKVDVDMEELLAYCAEHGLENSGKARSQFFAEMVSKGRWEKFENDFPVSGI